MAADIGTGRTRRHHVTLTPRRLCAMLAIEVNSDATATGVTGEAAAYQR